MNQSHPVVRNDLLSPLPSGESSASDGQTGPWRLTLEQLANEFLPGSGRFLPAYPGGCRN